MSSSSTRAGSVPILTRSRSRKEAYSSGRVYLKCSHRSRLHTRCCKESEIPCIQHPKRTKVVKTQCGYPLRADALAWSKDSDKSSSQRGSGDCAACTCKEASHKTQSDRIFSHSTGPERGELRPFSKFRLSCSCGCFKLVAFALGIRCAGRHYRSRVKGLQESGHP